MRNELVELLHVIQHATDGDERAEAVTHIAMILERHSSLRLDDTFYQSIIGNDLTTLQLSLAEQAALVDQLQALLSIASVRSQLIWAIGKAQRALALRTLLALLATWQYGLEEEALWELLGALNKYIVLDDSIDQLDQQDLLRNYPSIGNQLDRISKDSTGRVQNAAQLLRTKIQEVLQ